MVKNIKPFNDPKTTNLLLALFPLGMTGAIVLIYIVLQIADHKGEILDLFK